VSKYILNQLTRRFLWNSKTRGYFIKIEDCKKDLLFAITALDSCWGHHQDGSDLMVNESVLFDIVFNTVIRNVKSTLKVIDGILGESCDYIKTQHSCENPVGGHACKKAEGIYHEARKLVEDKQNFYNKFLKK
jgi:hypothetical protein